MTTKIIDLKGNYDGYVYGGAPMVKGRFGNAVDIQNTVAHSVRTGVHPGLTDEMAISCWVRFDTIPVVTNYRDIVTVVNGAADTGIGLVRTYNGARVHMGKSGPEAGTRLNIFAYNDAGKGHAPNTGQWHHYFCQYNAQSGNYEFWADGVAIFTTTPSVFGSYGTPAAAVVIGYGNDCQIDRVRLFDLTGRNAFTSAEIQRLANETPDAVLLIHSDDADGSTTFIDSSFSAHSPVANGTVQHDEAQKKFCRSSILFDGNSDYITVPTDEDWDLGEDDFTVETWIRFNTLQACGIIQAGEGACSGGPALNIAWGLFWFPNLLYFYRYDGTDYIRNVAWTPVADTWYHIMVIRTGDTLRFFVDGTQVGSDKDVSGLSYDRISSEDIFIGLYRSGSNCVNWNYLDGWQEEIRVIKGKAMQTSNFTPPSAPYDYVCQSTTTTTSSSTTSTT